MTETGEHEIIEFPAPLIVTSGDPAGVGPEVTHKAVKKLQRRKEIMTLRPLVVIGDAMLYARHLDKPSAMQTYHIIPVDDFLEDCGYLLGHTKPKGNDPWRPMFLDCGFRDENLIAPGKPEKNSAERATTYLEVAVEILADEIADAVCTGPICKDNMSREAFPFPGQTEFFADACNVKHPVMMLVGGGLRVSLVTIHLPLAKVPRALNRKAVTGTIQTTHDALVEDFGIAKPRIAVCGLNPHAGENGRFGNEEKKVIEPGIKAARKKGIDVDGPLSGDTVFHHAKEGRYDAVVAMYHDQGLIPVKTLAFHEGVNMTLGLPVVRTSPDHGTAFDIAGKNEASPDAMIHALRLANEVSTRREEEFINA